MKEFKITTKVVGELHPTDEEEGPKNGEEFIIDAETEDEALDKFHSTVPIKCLDDYDITCEEL